MQLIAEHLYSDASRNDPQQGGVPMVCTVDTFPHPAPLLAEYEPMSKNRGLHMLMPHKQI